MQGFATHIFTFCGFSDRGILSNNYKATARIYFRPTAQHNGMKTSETKVCARCHKILPAEHALHCDCCGNCYCESCAHALCLCECSGELSYFQ